MPGPTAALGFADESETIPWLFLLHGPAEREIKLEPNMFGWWNRQIHGPGLPVIPLQQGDLVGGLTYEMGLLGVGISLGLATFMKPQHRTACALVGGTMLVLSTLVFPLYLTGWALIAFGLLRAVGGPLHGNALAPVALQVIDRDPAPRAMRYDYIVHQELCLGVGRVLSIGCFLLLAAPVDQMLLARIVVVIAGAAPMLILAAFARISQAVPIQEADSRALPSAA